MRKKVELLQHCFISALDAFADPGFHLALDPGNSPSAQLDGLRELPKVDVLVDRRSSQPGAIHDVFDADESVAHDELLLFVHEMRLVSIF